MMDDLRIRALNDLTSFHAPHVDMHIHRNYSLQPTAYTTSH
jgi:hypothetical protein